MLEVCFEVSILSCLGFLCLIASCPVGRAVCSYSGSAFERASGLTIDMMLQENWADIYPPDDRMEKERVVRHGYLHLLYMLCLFVLCLVGSFGMILLLTLTPILENVP